MKFARRNLSASDDNGIRRKKGGFERLCYTTIDEREGEVKVRAEKFMGGGVGRPKILGEKERVSSPLIVQEEKTSCGCPRWAMREAESDNRLDIGISFFF